MQITPSRLSRSPPPAGRRRCSIAGPTAPPPPALAPRCAATKTAPGDGRRRFAGGSRGSGSATCPSASTGPARRRPKPTQCCAAPSPRMDRQFSWRRDPRPDRLALRLARPRQMAILDLLTGQPRPISPAGAVTVGVGTRRTTSRSGRGSRRSGRAASFGSILGRSTLRSREARVLQARYGREKGDDLVLLWTWTLEQSSSCSKRFAG